jgi:hypothetical protein
MTDITIGSLQLEISDAAGHQHRIQPIVTRAATVLAGHLSARDQVESRSPRSVYLDAIIAPALSIDLNHTSDEQAARQIAGAWFEALAPHLKA